MTGLQSRATKTTSYSATIDERSTVNGVQQTCQYFWQWSDGKHYFHRKANGNAPEYKNIYNGKELISLFKHKLTGPWDGIVAFAPDGMSQVLIGSLEGITCHQNRDLSTILSPDSLTVQPLGHHDDYGDQVQVTGSTVDYTYSMILAPERDWLCISSVWSKKDGKLREVASVGELKEIQGVWVPTAVSQKTMIKQGNGWQVTNDSDKIARNIKLGDPLSEELNLGTHFAGVTLWGQGTGDQYVINSSGDVVRVNESPTFNRQISQIGLLWVGILSLFAIPAFWKSRKR